jgi:drug/metabolite transporter (DMT)-like permease
VSALPPVNVDNPRLGIFMMVLSTTLFSGMWTIAKMLTARYPIVEVTFFRSAFGLLPVLPMIITNGGWSALRPHRFSKHVWRAVLGVSGLTLNVLSYHLMPLADATAISFATPLVATALSVPLLKERVGLFRWSAVIVGFIGVLVIVRPGGDMLNFGALVAVAAACITGVVYVTLRQLNRIDRPVTIVIYFLFLSTVFTSGPMVYFWVPPTPTDWALAALMGLFGGFAQYAMTKAFGLARAAVVSPFGYMGLLWSGLLGWVIWSDVPGTHVFMGAPIVIASGLFILYRETKKQTP